MKKNIAGCIGILAASTSVDAFATDSYGGSDKEEFLEQICPTTRVYMPEGNEPVLGASLWRPEYSRFYSSGMANDFKEDRSLTLYRGGGSWELPVKPEWDENPFNNRTWLTFYNSLGWVYVLFYDAYENNNPNALQEAKELIFSWMHSHPIFEASLQSEPWRDHPTAFRLSNLSHYYQWLEPILTPEEKDYYISYLSHHAEYLIKLFPLPDFYGHNHGFMDAMAVYTAGAAFPEISRSEFWRNRASERLSELFEEMLVDGEGISREQSFGYHFYVTRLLIESGCLSLATTGEDIEGFLDQTKSALEFSAIVSYSDGTIPASGDSYFRQSSVPADKYYIDYLSSDVSSFIKTEGEVGELW